MSDHNVQLTRRFTDAWNARDLETMIACCDEDIEYHSTFAAADGAVYHGHDGLRSYQRDLQDAWGDEIRFEVEAYFDLGDTTVGFFVMHGRGRRSGIEVTTLGATAVMRWREGLLVYLKAYLHREDAFRDLGVSEGDLAPIEP